MALPVTTDSLESIPETLRGAYVQKDGKFVLDAEIEDVSGLKKTVKATRDEREAAERRAKEAEARAAELQQKIEQADLASKGLTDAKKEWDEKYLKPTLDKLTAKEMEIRSLKLDGKIQSAAFDAEVIDPKAFWKLHGEDFDLDDKGQPFFKADPSKPIKEAIESYRETESYLFKGTQAAGGGAAGIQGSGSAGSNAKPVEKWTSEEIKSFIDKHGEAKHRELLSARTVELYTTKPAA
jgi:hypothetical protein